MFNHDGIPKDNIYKPEKPPVLNSNQETYRLNYLSTFIANQSKQNIEINTSIEQVLSTVNSIHLSQEEKINLIIEENGNQKQNSEFVMEKISTQSQASDKILDTINKLGSHYQQLNQYFENEQLIHQAILDQLSFQDNQLKQTTFQLEKYVALATELSNQLNSQDTLLKEMEKKLEIQEVYHTTVMNKLDKQEVMNEKTNQQIENLRLSLHEKATLILEKVESSFKTMKAYVNDTFNKLGLMMPFLLTNKSKDKNKENRQL